MEEKVSIIIPVYNVDKYLSKCLDSVCVQTYSNLQIIVVDDKATDKSGDICDSYKDKDSRILVIHKEHNEGLGLARNTGLEYADGEYVIFIDSDDWIANDHVEKLVNAAVSNDADMVICGHIRYVNDEKKIHRKSVEQPEVLVGTDIINNVLMALFAASSTEKRETVRETSVWLSLYKLKCIRENDLKFVSERIYGSEDMLFNFDYIMQTQKVVMIPDCTYFYRYNSNSLSNTYRETRMHEIFKLTDCIEDRLKTYGLKDAAEFRIDRMLILKTRRTLMIVANCEKPFKEKIQTIRRIMGMSKVENAIRRYPLNRYSAVQKVSAILIKHKLAFEMIMYGKLYYLLKNH